MRRLALPIAFLAACASGDPNDIGASGLAASATGSTTGEPIDGSSTGSTSSADPSATTSTLPPGSTSDAVTSTGELDGSSSSSGEPEASWRRYTLETASGSWTEVPLDELWAGSNAPPSSGIAATVSLTHFDRLLVISEDGTFYERADGVWQTPVPVGERFPAAAALEVDAMTHVPNQQGDSEDLYLIDTPVTAVYAVFDNGGVELDRVVELEDAEDGPPQASVDNGWVFAVADLGGMGRDPEWLEWYMAFANAEFWRFSAFQFTLLDFDGGAFFSGAPGEPDPLSAQAAYFDDDTARAHFIGP